MKRIIGGIQPSNQLHIGNLFGCINLFKQFKNHELYLFVPDIHSLTSQQHITHNNIYDVIRYFIAVIGSQSNMYFYIQSQHNYIFKLSFILSTHTPLGDLQRMTQYKDKSHENVNSGLLYYPILMAADILAINANIVPVGKDQTQHIELTRRIAEKFNSCYKNPIFKLPIAHVLEDKLIYNLQDPTIKMSKSKGSTKGVIFLNDDKSSIINKIKKAVSDSLPMPSSIDELYNRPAIQNLCNIYALCTELSLTDVIMLFQEKPISIFKEDLAIKLSDYIHKLHSQAQMYSNDDIINIINNSFIHMQNIFKLQEDLINTLIYV